MEEDCMAGPELDCCILVAVEKEDCIPEEKAGKLVEEESEQVGKLEVQVDRLGAGDYTKEPGQVGKLGAGDYMKEPGQVGKLEAEDCTKEEICRLLAEEQRCKERLRFEEVKQLDDVGGHAELELAEVLRV
jgi:hypothetical protein